MYVNINCDLIIYEYSTQAKQKKQKLCEDADMCVQRINKKVITGQEK